MVFFDYNHRNLKRKAPSPPQSGSDTDDDDLIVNLNKRPAAIADIDDDDDIEIIEIIEAPRPPLNKKAGPPAPALSKILKQEREEQEVLIVEKRLKFKQYVSEKFRKKTPPAPPPAPVLSNYLEKERVQEEKMLKFKKYLSERFPHRSKLSPDEEERLRNLTPNNMYLDQYEKFNEDKDNKPRTINETDSKSTNEESGDNNDDPKTTTDDIKMIVPNPKFSSTNNKISANSASKTAIHTTLPAKARNQSETGTGDQYKEDYDFLLNGIPNDLQYRISEYATWKSNNPRLANQNSTEGFLFLKEKKQDEKQNHKDYNSNKGSRSSRYFYLSHSDKDSVSVSVTPIQIQKSNNSNSLTMRKDAFFDTGDNYNNKGRKLFGRKRSSSPSLLDTSAQTTGRYLPFINSTSTLSAFNNSKEITPTGTTRGRPPTPSLLSSPVEENVNECQGQIISKCLSPPRDDFENVFLQIPLIRMPTPTPSVESVEEKTSPDKFDFENDFDIYNKEKDQTNSDLESEDVNTSITVNPNPFERITLHPPTPDASDIEKDISLSEELEVKINPFDISTTTESSLENPSGSVGSEIESHSSDGHDDESFVCPITIRTDIFEDSLSSCSFEVDEDQNQQNITPPPLSMSMSVSNEKDHFYYYNTDKPATLSIRDPVKIIPTSSKNAQFALHLENNPETLRSIQNLLNGSRVVFQEFTVPTCGNTDDNPFRFLGGILNENTFSNSNVDNSD